MKPSKSKYRFVVVGWSEDGTYYLSDHCHGEVLTWTLDFGKRYTLQVARAFVEAIGTDGAEFLSNIRVIEKRPRTRGQYRRVVKVRLASERRQRKLLQSYGYS